MLQSILVGLVAGLATALLFVAPFGGTPLAIPLFAATGLPIAIAGFGWGAVAAAVAVVIGAAVTFALGNAAAGLAPADWIPAAIFLFLFGIPAGLATLVAILPRVGEGAPRWPTLGVILATAAAAVAVGVVGVGIVIGFDPQVVTQGITAAVVDWAASADSGLGTAPTAADIEPWVSLNVLLLPATVGAVGVGMIVLDLYLGAKSVGFSSRLKRPDEPMWSVTIPLVVPAVLVVATVAAFVPGPAGRAAEAVAGALGAATALVGFATVHTLTRGNSWRAPVLAVMYALTVLSGIPLVLFALLGTAETLLHLRARRATRSRGPTPTS